MPASHETTLIDSETAARFVILSGCSGGGKSTLLAALAARGYATVEEPGRRIVKAELARGGAALPWTDMAAFLRLAIEMSLEDRQASASQGGWVFFDRGLIDAASGLDSVTGERVLDALAQAHPYHRRVFLTPPWPQIYTADAERRHDFEAALDEYHRLLRVYPELGYEAVLLPKVDVEARADFVLHALCR